MWLKAPATLGEIVSISHGNQQYPVVDGVVEMPDSHGILLEMGFIRTGPPLIQVKDPTGPAKPSGGDDSAGKDKPKPLRLKKR